ncbi:HesA/MoeB/ThiF family protein [Rubrimonas cliftonensis]|uniref:Molybdopterin-synthase adenylyltransferase n=1 Tax=Rubrimonas cliftonensis TaxID=89524 RepID=A0A1H3X1F9_9RHOB|nr:Molybdopterin or thiamine biosynthesis adenylyltransferase [Rubrimonas cliftonensis]
MEDAALDRYARHIVLREIGGPGQRRLGAAQALVLGAGGLGAPALMYLAAAGVGRLRVVDHDTVSLSNLQRQVIHATERVGRLKVESAAEALAAINPLSVVEPVAERLTAENAATLLDGCALALDGCDDAATRRILNAACVAAGIPLVSAAVGQWEGQIAVYHPAAGGPCYACVFPVDAAAGLAPSCAEAGVLGALTGVMGALQAVEAVKLITGAGEPLIGRLMLYDALSAETRTLVVKRRADCPACGTPSATDRPAR